MKIKNLLYLILLIFVFSCDKELDITQFESEFNSYRPELKIEGLLKVDKPEDSFIRIIKSVSITDNELYNGIDDDGDGLIDEQDELVAKVQDTSATVMVTNLDSGEEINFSYFAKADSAPEYKQETDVKDELSWYYYGGYKPVITHFQIIPGASYRVDIYSREFDKTISGTTTAYPSIQFIDTLHTFQDSLIIIKGNNSKELFWKSDLNVSAYYITFEEVLTDGANIDFDYISAFLFSKDNRYNDIYSNVSVGRLVLPDFGTEILLRITIEAISPEYGQYIFSGLPLNDPQRSNLRDSDGNPVMGSIGSSAAKSIYVLIEE